jgi:hypothetical protein
VSHGESQKGIAAVQVQLHADIGSMVFDGSDADVQISRDLAAGLRVSDELKDAPLGGSKIVEPRLFLGKRLGSPTPAEEIGGERRAYKVVGPVATALTLSTISARALSLST